MQVLPEDITISAIIPRNSLIFHYSRRSSVLLFGYEEVLVRRRMEGQGGSSEGLEEVGRSVSGQGDWKVYWVLGR